MHHQPLSSVAVEQEDSNITITFIATRRSWPFIPSILLIVSEDYVNIKILHKNQKITSHHYINQWIDAESNKDV